MLCGIPESEPHSPARLGSKRTRIPCAAARVAVSEAPAVVGNWNLAPFPVLRLAGLQANDVREEIYLLPPEPENFTLTQYPIARGNLRYSGGAENSAPYCSGGCRRKG